MTDQDKNGVVGVALCGFGRAGQIHFHGIRQNHRCSLRYVVDIIEEPGVLERITAVLTEYHMTHVKPVSKKQFDEVPKIFDILLQKFLFKAALARL